MAFFWYQMFRPWLHRQLRQHDAPGQNERRWAEQLGLLARGVWHLDHVQYILCVNDRWCVQEGPWLSHSCHWLTTAILRHHHFSFYISLSSSHFLGDLDDTCIGHMAFFWYQMFRPWLHRQLRQHDASGQNREALSWAVGSAGPGSVALRSKKWVNKYCKSNVSCICFLWFRMIWSCLRWFPRI